MSPNDADLAFARLFRALGVTASAWATAEYELRDLLAEMVGNRLVVPAVRHLQAESVIAACKNVMKELALPADVNDLILDVLAHVRRMGGKRSEVLHRAWSLTGSGDGLLATAQAPGTGTFDNHALADVDRIASDCDRLSMGITMCIRLVATSKAGRFDPALTAGDRTWAERELGVTRANRRGE